MKTIYVLFRNKRMSRNIKSVGVCIKFIVLQIVFFHASAQKISNNLDTVDMNLVIQTGSDSVHFILAKTARLQMNDCGKMNLGLRKQIAYYLLESDSLFSRNWETEKVHARIGAVPSDSHNIPIILRMGEEEFHYGCPGELYWGYGPRWGRIHRGLDTKLDIGDSIVASFNGVVRFSSYDDGGYGKCVVIRHFNGLETLYAHLSKLMVSSGDLVCSGEVIGLAGVTGRSNGPHLHFETRYNGYSFNPFLCFTEDSFKLKCDTLVLKSQDFYYETEQGIESAITKHKVKTGETLTAIAKKYHTSVKKIVAINRLKNPNNLRVGQTLRIKK